MVEPEVVEAREPGGLPRYADLAAWDAVVSRRDDSYELVEGVPTMAPGESPRNRIAGTLLAGVLNAGRRRWIAGTDLDVTLAGDPAPTVRRPDVVLVRPEVGRRDGSGRVDAADVVLVAEVVSPSSVERDFVTKRREYAQVGIPAYLVVDLRAESGTLTLYELVDARGTYEVSQSGSAVTVTIDGHPVAIEVDDLLA